MTVKLRRALQVQLTFKKKNVQRKLISVSKVYILIYWIISLSSTTVPFHSRPPWRASSHQTNMIKPGTSQAVHVACIWGITHSYSCKRLARETRIWDGWSAVRISAESKVLYLLLNVETVSRTNPVPCPKEYVSSYPDESGCGVLLPNHLHVIDIMNDWNYTSAPAACLRGMDRHNFTFYTRGKWPVLRFMHKFGGWYKSGHKNSVLGYRLDTTTLGQRAVVDSCEEENEPQNFTIWKMFLDHPSVYQLQNTRYPAWMISVDHFVQWDIFSKQNVNQHYILCYITLYYTKLYYIILHYIIFYYITLY